MNTSRIWALLPLAILAFALGLRIADPPAIERLRLTVFDEYQHLQPRVWQDADVRIADIDDASLEKLGQWPWPRTHLAQLVERLADAGAAAIAFDAIFAEPDRTSPVQQMSTWTSIFGEAQMAAMAGRLPDHDAIFAQALANAPAVLGFMLIDQTGPRRPARKSSFAVAGNDPRPFLPVYSGAASDLPALEAASSGIGAINSAADRDGVIRRSPLLLRLTGAGTVSEEVYPSLAAEALRVAQRASTYIVRTSGASGVKSFGQNTGIDSVQIGAMRAPTDFTGQFWLYDTGPAPQRAIPAWRIVAGEVDPAELEGKIVFVGFSAAALKDIRATPLNPVAAGVEVHAQIAEQIILGSFVERPDLMTGAELAWLLALGLTLTLLLPRWGAAWCALVAVGVVLVAFGTSWLAFTEFGLLVDPVYPSLAALLLYLSQSFVLYLRTEAERRHVRGAFGRYMSPALVEILARDPAALRLGGEIRDMTLLFCDIRGFTAISERMDAENLTQFLNRFLTPMTDIILSRRGTVDKYMGDAIMAFWNAPLADDDHAANAARAALDMIARLETLNAVWRSSADQGGPRFPELAIGIGLNTGKACVGNMGSEQRFDYSVIGDAVNLASRLEGQSRSYGAPIMIGEDTQARIPDFAALELDLIMVKGRATAVRIFALLGDEKVAAEPWFRAASAAQRDMLAAYRARDWSGAGAALAQVRAAGDGRLDGICDMFTARLAAYIGEPPPGDWDGVYRAAEK